MRRAMLYASAACAAVAMALSAGAALGPGDAAPPIKVAKWFKGTPVSAFEPGKVYVVEFWATWCGPCRTSIPHLTELAHKYKGKVTFAGISVWERDPAYIEKVGKFVEEMGDKMVYNIAADDEAGTMAATWMTAAGERGIPSAFVVDGAGKIAWIGHPMSDLGPTLDKVLAGTWDVAAYKKKRASDQAAEEAQMRLNRELTPLMREKKYDQALRVLDAAIARDKSLEKGYAVGRFTILLKVDEARAQAYALKVARDFYRDEPMYLNQLAWLIVSDDTELKKPNFTIALQIAQMASAASKNGDPDILDTLAMAQFRSGKRALAVQTEKKALTLARQMGRPDQVIADMEKRLAGFTKTAK